MSKRELWIALRSKGYSQTAVAVILGHATAESGCECNRVQGDFSTERTLSRQYTAQVDNGVIDRYTFAHSGPNGGGYGLVQWTYPTRKLGLYDTAKRLGASIGSEKAAVAWLDQELHQAEYAPVLAALTGGGSIRAISDVFMRRFERPADQSEAACAYRASLAQAVLDELSDTGTAAQDDTAAESTEPQIDIGLPTLKRGDKGRAVMAMQGVLIALGYSCGKCGADGIFGSSTYVALCGFQADIGLEVTGECCARTWYALLIG